MTDVTLGQGGVERRTGERCRGRASHPFVLEQNTSLPRMWAVTCRVPPIPPRLPPLPRVGWRSPVGSHSTSVAMKCSAVAMVSISSTLKNSSWPLSALKPASTMFLPCGDQTMWLHGLAGMVPERMRGSGRGESRSSKAGEEKNGGLQYMLVIWPCSSSIARGTRQRPWYDISIGNTHQGA